MIFPANTLILLVLSFACVSNRTPGPEFKPIIPLPAELDECSGLIYLGNGLYAGLNDSGNDAELFIFKLSHQPDTRTVKITGASNHDWEELTADSSYVYISDTGNNSGNRKDLKIYRISKAELIQNDEVPAEEIAFYYPEQKKFEPSNKHNFDCEAMICAGDSLYLFTKNRGNSKTDLYSIPKKPGNYQAKYHDRFDAMGLITGADFRQTPVKNSLVLIGYTVEGKGYHPFILYFPDVKGTEYFKGPFERMMFDGKLQTETIFFHDGRSVYVTNEEEHGDKGFIYQVDIQK